MFSGFVFLSWVLYCVFGFCFCIVFWRACGFSACLWVWVDWFGYVGRGSDREVWVPDCLRGHFFWSLRFRILMF